MEASSTPRITCAYLDSYVGKNVIVVGKVVQLRGDEAIIDADGNITAHLHRVSFHPLPPHYILGVEWIWWTSREIRRGWMEAYSAATQRWYSADRRSDQIHT